MDNLNIWVRIHKDNPNLPKLYFRRNSNEFGNIGESIKFGDEIYRGSVYSDKDYNGPYIDKKLEDHEIVALRILGDLTYEDIESK